MMAGDGQECFLLPSVRRCSATRTQAPSPQPPSTMVPTVSGSERKAGVPQAVCKHLDGQQRRTSWEGPLEPPPKVWLRNDQWQLLTPAGQAMRGLLQTRTPPWGPTAWTACTRRGELQGQQKPCHSHGQIRAT